METLLKSKTPQTYFIATSQRLSSSDPQVKMSGGLNDLRFLYCYSVWISKTID